MHIQSPFDMLGCIIEYDEGDRMLEKSKDDFDQMAQEHVRIKKTLLVLFSNFYCRLSIW